MSNLNRYKDIFKLNRSSANIPDVKISNRDTDIYVTYTEVDRLDLIANKIYGFPSLYWIILAANGHSFEYDIEIGEVIRIPYPLQEVMTEIRKSM